MRDTSHDDNMDTTLKEKAREFLLLCAGGNSREAFRLHAGAGFKHHNAYFRGDGTTLMVAMEDSARQHPDKEFVIQRELEDGNLTAFHSFVRMHPGEPGYAVMHIFRFDGDKIVEMWDFGQPVPSDSPNENGMF